MPPALPFRKSFAVAIGIDHYAEGIPSLRTAVNDARRLGETLGTLHQYEVITLLDGEATAQRVTEVLTTTLPAQVTADDRVLFYFAGHGVALDGDEGPNGYLIPADAVSGQAETYLHMPTVHDALLALPCRHMLVVLDSCFSGAFEWSRTRSLQPAKEVVHREKFDRFVRTPAWQVLTSASQDQLAVDKLSVSALGSRGAAEADHSPFAAALFAAIAGEGDVIPAGTGDGLVTASELYVFLEDRLQRAVATVGRTQTPRLFPLRKHDKGEFVFFVPGREMNLPPAPELTFDRNPWAGLNSYDTASAALFFGRDKEIAALRAAIPARPLTVVLGSSGSGKSSLVKAGVVPHLQNDGWLVLPGMRPGSAPMAALAQAVSPVGGPVVAASPEAITARVAALAAEQGGRRILLVIDQFEELITLASNTTDRRDVMTLLASLLAAHPDTLRLVLTIRTDFEPNFVTGPFGAQWTAGRYVIPAMSRDSLREVIEKPAAARVLYFEPSQLVETLLDEITATPGALPLLSFALSEMYIEFVKRRSSDRAITTADYDAVGGVAGALRSRAEKELATLDAAQQATLRRVMLRMVSGEGAALARRRLTDADIDFVDAGERARAATVIARFTAARLLVEGREPNGEKFVEPAHDALVRSWGTLQDWIAEEQRAAFSLAQQQRLARAAQEWERADARERDGQLWRDGPRSAQLAPLVRDKAPWLTTRELTFARRSIRGRNIGRATAAAAVLLIAVAGVVATIAGIRATRRAEENRVASIVRSAQAAASEDPLLAAQLLGSIDSAMVEQLDAGTRLSLISTTLQLNSAPQVEWTFGDGPPLSRAIISRNGAWVADLPVDGWLGIRDLTKRVSHVLTAASDGEFGDAVFDREGTMLAVGTIYGEVLLQCLRDLPEGMKKAWSPESEGVRVVRLNRSTSRMLLIDTTGVARVVPLPSPCDASTGDYTKVPTLVSASGIVHGDFVADDGLVLTDSLGALWLVSPDGRRRLRYPGARGATYTTLAVSPDGRQVAVGASDGSLRTVEVAQRPRVTVLLTDDSVMSLAFSADGGTLASAHLHSGVHRWRLADGMNRVEAGTGDDPHDRLVFDPGSNHLIGASLFERHVTVFDSVGKAYQLKGLKDEVLAVSVTAEGRRMVTVSRDGNIWVWRPAVPPLHHGAPRLVTERLAGGDVAAIAFAPDARQVALGTLDGWVFRYRIDSVAGAVPFDRDTGAIRALYWGADGQSLHALRDDGSRTHWTWSADRLTKRTASPAVTHGLFDAIPADDGRHVVAATLGLETTVWDLASDRPPFRMGGLPSDLACPPGTRLGVGTAAPECAGFTPYCLALSGDGTQMAACAGGDTIEVVATDGRTPSRKFGRFNMGVRAGAISRDGTRLAASADSSILLWKLDAPPAEPRELTVGDGEVQLLAFSPDGERLATRQTDRAVRVIDLRTGAPVFTVRTTGEFADGLRFSPDGRLLLAYGFAQREARLWNLTGGSGTLPVRVGGLSVRSVAFSPDSKWVVIADDDQTARLVPLDAHLALAPFRRNRECLPAALRERYLLETGPVARTRAARCRPMGQRSLFPVATTPQP